MSAFPHPPASRLQPVSGASSRPSVINRTHRVVRERAVRMKAQRSRNRALLVPLLIASSLVIILLSSVWIMFDEYELAPSALADSRFHLSLVHLWFLPVTGALFIVALLRRFRGRSEGEESR